MRPLPVRSGSGQRADKADISFQKIIVWKAISFFPNDFFEGHILGVATEFGDPIENQEERRTARIRIFVPRDFRANFSMNGQFFGEFAPEGVRRRFARLNFAAGKFPFQFMPGSAEPLRDQDLIIAFDHSGDYRKHG